MANAGANQYTFHLEATGKIRGRGLLGKGSLTMTACANIFETVHLE